MTTNTVERFSDLVFKQARTDTQNHWSTNPHDCQPSELKEYAFVTGYMESFLQYLSATVPGVEQEIQHYITQMEERQAKEAA